MIPYLSPELVRELLHYCDRPKVRASPSVTARSQPGLPLDRVAQFLKQLWCESGGSEGSGGTAKKLSAIDRHLTQEE